MCRRPGVEGEHVSSYPPNLAPYLTRTLTVRIDKSDFYICLLMSSAVQFSAAELLVLVVKECFNYLFNYFIFVEFQGLQNLFGTSTIGQLRTPTRESVDPSTPHTSFQPQWVTWLAQPITEVGQKSRDATATSQRPTSQWQQLPILNYGGFPLLKTAFTQSED